MWQGNMSETRPHENEVCISEALDKLREEILKLERELGRFGYDSRRGIESYSISELKGLIGRAGPERLKVRELLVRLVNIQEELYKELYCLAGLKELNVDTETPEKNVLRLKKWLLAGEVAASPGNVVEAKTKFERALEAVVETLRTCQENCEDELLNALRGVYKRDYDRYRVIKHALEVCVKLGYTVDLSKLDSASLESAARLLSECARNVGVPELAAHLKMTGARR